MGGAKFLNSIGGISDVVRQMVVAVPDFSVGKALHDNFKWAIEAATPGQWMRITTLYPIPVNYSDTFFPNRGKSAFVQDLPNMVPFTNWSDFAVALCCLATNKLIPGQKTLNITKAQTAVDSYNKILFTGVTPAYSRLFAETWPDFKDALAKVASKPQAKAEYIKVLKEGVNIREIWYAEGLWKHPEWELYHHWIKLLALGATTEEIDGLITELIGLGLTIAPTVQAKNWTSFTGFLQDNGTIDEPDIAADGKAGITGCHGEYLNLPSPLPLPGPTIVNVSNAKSFFFPGTSAPDDYPPGPGAAYYQPAPSSCFTANTPILLADGSLRPISEMAPGMSVATSLGPQKIALITKVYKRNRKLLSFQDQDFGFTSGHPFVSGHPDVGFLGSDQQELAKNVPNLWREGIGSLEKGALILVKRKGEDTVKVEPCVALRDASKDFVEEVELYDLVLEPSKNKRSNYFVGRSPSILAASELPLFDSTPGAAIALIEAVKRSIVEINRFQFQFHGEKIAQALEHIEDYARPVLVPWSLSELEDTEPPSFQLNDIHGYINDFMPYFLDSKGSFGSLFSNYFGGILRSIGDELDCVVRLGWRSPGKRGADKLAMTVFATHFYTGNLDFNVNDQMCLAVSWPAYKGKNRVELVPQEEKGKASAIFYDRVIEILENPEQDEGFVFELSNKNGKVLAKATYPIPGNMEFGYRHLQLPLVNSQNKQVGEVWCDLRNLDSETLTSEIERKAAWNKEAQYSYAHSLGSVLGHNISKIVLLHLSRSGLKVQELQ